MAFYESLADPCRTRGMDEKTKQIVRALARAVCETVAECGPLGAPSGAVYAALMAYGCSLSQYESLVSTMVTAGMLRKEGQTLYAA